MNVIGNTLEELYRIFNILNRDKFDDKLPEPIITIQKTKGKTLGHFTLEKVWKNKNDNLESDLENEDKEENSFYEINIDPRWFNSRTAEQIVETLLHEMCHYMNKILDIKDCNGNIHNKKFKSMAESVGLIVEKADSVGFGFTELSDELIEYIELEVKPNEKAFEYFRCTTIEIKPKKRRKKSTFKYTCPDCGQTVKAKADASIKCGDCDTVMEIEDYEPDEDNDGSDENEDS